MPGSSGVLVRGGTNQNKPLEKSFRQPRRRRANRLWCRGDHRVWRDHRRLWLPGKGFAASSQGPIPPPPGRCSFFRELGTERGWLKDRQGNQPRRASTAHGAAGLRWQKVEQTRLEAPGAAWAASATRAIGHCGEGLDARGGHVSSPRACADDEGGQRLRGCWIRRWPRCCMHLPTACLARKCPPPPTPRVEPGRYTAR